MDGIRFDHFVKSTGKSSSRRRAVKALGGGVVGTLATQFGIRLRRGDAMPIQNIFVADCRQNGGETRSVATRVVRCTYKCAFSTQCNFIYDPPQCFDILHSC